MYRIMIKHNSNVKSLWEVYGSTTASTGSNETTFTEFETDDVDILREEVMKIMKEIGNSEIRVVQDVTLVYGVTVVENEE